MNEEHDRERQILTDLLALMHEHDLDRVKIKLGDAVYEIDRRLPGPPAFGSAAGTNSLDGGARPDSPEATPTPFYYPRPGKNNAKVKLGIVPVTGGKTTWIEWNDAKYPYLASVRWSKKAPLCVTVQTRDQRELVLLAADPKTGKTYQVINGQLHQ